MCVEVCQLKCHRNTVVSTLSFLLNPAGRLHTRSITEKLRISRNKQFIGQLETQTAVAESSGFPCDQAWEGAFSSLVQPHKNSPVPASAVPRRFWAVLAFGAAVGEGRSTKWLFTGGTWVALLLLLHRPTEPPQFHCGQRG